MRWGQCYRAGARQGRARCLGRLLGALTLATVGLSAVAQPVEKPLPKPPQKAFNDGDARRVINVSSGDTLVVSLDGRETTVRMIGLFAPESGTQRDEARSYAARLLLGESVYLEADPGWARRGGEDPLWAYVYRAPDGLFVNLELVRLGFARVAAGAPFAQQKLMRAYEQHARRHQKGLWRRNPPQTAEPATSQPAATSLQPEPKRRTEADESATVYVTKYGRKYHRKDCQHVRGKGIQLSLKEARAKGYTPCSRCKPPS